jgi:uncharacterized membrane protein YcaP (DUF421 family)
MAQYITRETVIEFLLGFIIGKLIGSVVSSIPYFEFISDPALSDVFYVEFVNNTLSFNGYHYTLAIMGGLILVIWRSDELFD